MADEQNIGFQITVNTKPGEQNVTTLKQDIDALQAAIEKASKIGLNINIDGKEKTIAQAEELRNKLRAILDEINSHHIENVNKAANAEAQAAQKAAEARIKEEQRVTQALKKEQDKRLNEEIKQLETAEKLALAEEKRRQKISAWNYDSTPKGNQLEFGGAVKQTGFMNPTFVAQMREQFASRQAIVEAEERTAIASQKRIEQAEETRIKNTSKALQELEKERQRQQTGNSTLEQRDRDRANSVTHANRQSDLNEAFNPRVDKFISYTSQLNTLNQKYEETYQKMKQGKIGQEEYIQSMTKLKTEATAVQKNMSALPSLLENIGNKAGYAGSFIQKLRSHFNWILAGGLIGASIAIPTEFVTTIKNVEQGMAGMNQVLDHTKLANEAAELGVNEHTYAQQKLNQETIKFIDIAAIYGEKINDTIESGKLWGRAYKDLSIVNELVHQSMILAVADNFSLTDANKGLEAAMFQYGLVAKNATEATAYASKIVDTWTKVAHNAQVSAQDLAHGVEQAGSVAHMTGVDFEFLTAMIATGVRATGKTGNEIGTMIKSVLGSFQSDKAQKELAKLGITIKEIGDDGAEHFKKAQDVLLDLALTAQSTDKDVSKMFQAISGGKWQWSKAAAMLGDYKEFIKTWELAVNSAGFAAGQVDMQLDTLTRRMERVKVDMQGLFVNVGNSGITQFLKEEVTGIDELILGLGKLSGTAVKTIAGLALLSTVLVAGARVWLSYRNAVAEAALATTAFGKASIFLSKTNIVVAVLTVVAVAIGTYVEKLGEAEEKERQLDNARENSIAKANQQLDAYKQQSEFVQTLITAHQRMTEQLNSGTLSAEKAAVVQSNLSATTEELTKITGDNGIAELVTAGKYDEASQIEKQAYQDKSDEIRKQIADVRAKQIEYTKNQIEWAQKRVDALQTETAAWGLWAKSLKSAMDMYAGLLDIQLTAKGKMLNTPFASFYGGNYQLAQSIDNDKAYRESLRSWRPESIVEEINQLSDQIEQNKIKLGQLEISAGTINYESNKVGGDTVVPGEGKQHGAKNPPMDKSGNIESKVDKFQLDSTIDKAKISADKYKAILAEIDNIQNRLGASYGLLDQRISAMNTNMTNLQNTIGKLSTQAQGDIDRINDLASQTGATITVSNSDRQYYDLAQQVGQQTSINPDFIWAQWYHETGGFSSDLANNSNNFGGLKNSNGDYMSFGSPEEFAEYFAKYIVKYDEDGIFGSGNIEEYAAALKHGGYFEDSTGNYVAGMYNALANGGEQEVTVEGLSDVLSTHGVSQEDWKGYSSEQKLAFTRQYKEDINNGNLLIGYLERLIDIEKKKADYQKQLAEAKKTEYETIVKGIETVEQYQEKLNDLRARTTIASYGINVTDVQNDQVELQKLIDDKKALDTAIEQAKKDNIDITKDPTFMDKSVKSKELENSIQAQRVKISESTYAQSARNAQYQYDSSVAKMGNHPEYVENQYEEQRLKVEELNKLIAAKEKEIEGYKRDGVSKDTKQWQQATLELQKYKNELALVGDKYYLVRDKAADMFDSLIVQQTGWKNFWKNAWKEMASEAIKRLFQVKAQAGTLSSILGFFGFGGSSKSVLGTTASNGFNYASNFGITSLLGHAEGTISDTEHIAAISEGNKKEAIIPMENASRGIPLWFETGKQMGLIRNSNGVEPNLKNPDLAKQSINVNVQQQQNHINELEKQTKALVTQNQLMIEVINKMGDGGNTVAQPIVMQQNMSMDDFMNMYYKAQKFNYIK